MKTKHIVMVASIFIILIAIYVLFDTNTIYEFQKERLTQMAATGNNNEKMLILMENGSYQKIMFFFSIVHILLGIYLFCVAKKNQILIKKEKIIVASAVCLVSSAIAYTSYVAILIIALVATAKRKNPEDYPHKEKLEMPTNEPKALSKKDIVLFVLLIMLYIFYFVADYFLPENLPKNILRIITIALYSLLYILAILCLGSIFKEDIKLFVKNHAAYAQHVLPIVGIMYIVYLSLSILISIIFGDITSLNQSAIEKLPLYISAPLAILWAPVVEELIFRGCVHKIIKNKKAFIIVSGLLFGFLHTMTEENITNMLVLAIPYTTLGVFFAYVYAKTENLSNNILMHAFHNFLGVIVIALLKA